MTSERDEGAKDTAKEPLGHLSEDRRRLLDALLGKAAVHPPEAAPPPPPPPPTSAPGTERGTPSGTPSMGAPQPGAVPPPPAGPWSPLVAMKPSGSRPPFFCVHALFGSVFPYHHLALHLGKEQPFFGLQARGLDGAQPPIETIEEMASTYLTAIRAVQPRGPYHLGGYSFGGLVAFEMAQQLIRQGERVAVLAMLGTGAPPPNTSGMADSFNLMAKQLQDFQRLVLHTVMAERAPGTEWLTGVLQSQGYMSPIARVTAANTLAGLRYALRPYPAGLDVFTTTDLQAMHPGDTSLGWRTFCAGKVETHPLEGSHLSMFQEPEVRDLARKLTLCLERDAADGPPRA